VGLQNMLPSSIMRVCTVRGGDALYVSVCVCMCEIVCVLVCFFTRGCVKYLGLSISLCLFVSMFLLLKHLKVCSNDF